MWRDVFPALVCFDIHVELAQACPHANQRPLCLWFWELIWLCVRGPILVLVWAKVLNNPVHSAAGGAQEDHCGENAYAMN